MSGLPAAWYEAEGPTMIYVFSYTSAIPYVPILDILRENCGITSADSPASIAAKVRSGLQEVAMDPEAGGHYLLQLLGVHAGTDQFAMLSPEAIKLRTFETLRQMSLRGSQRQPLIVAIENVHWIDQTSEDCLTLLVDSLAGAPILLLLTSRPGYRPPWIGKSYRFQLTLQPLTPPDSRSIVQAVLQTAPPPERLTRRILGKAAGHPFFLEELAWATLQDEGLRSDVTIPDTIQGVLMARIDRLSALPKRLLQMASVLGRKVPLQLLEAIWERADDLAPHLAALQRLELLYECPAIPEPVYTFKHVLGQEAAYASLPVGRRRALHGRTARAMEALAGLSCVAEALVVIESTGEGYHAAEIHRLKGELLLMQGGSAAAAQAEVCLRRALTVARRQDAKSHELRGGTSLARLWRAQGRRREARKLLAPIYDWFTEEFETPDLQEARHLLDALSAEI